MSRLNDIAKQYAQSVRQCEALRTTEAYPQPQWRAEWDRRMKLQSELLKEAARL